MRNEEEAFNKKVGRLQTKREPHTHESVVRDADVLKRLWIPSNDDVLYLNKLLEERRNEKGRLGVSHTLNVYERLRTSECTSMN